MSGSSVTVEELQAMYSIDRQIYRRLIINLGRDLVECMNMIALWVWLEDIGYPNIILKMLTLPDGVINEIADEAVLCLGCLQSEIPPLYSSTVTEIPATQELMEGRPISLSSLHEYRPSALPKITQTVNDVWARAFDDINQQALANRASSSSIGGSVQQELVGPSAGLRPAFQPPMFGSGIGISPPPAAVIGTGDTANLLPHAAAGIVFQQRIINPETLSSSSSSVVDTGESSQTALNPTMEPSNPNNGNVPPAPADTS